MLLVVIIILSVQILYEIFKTQSLKGHINRKPRQEDQELANRMKQDINDVRNMLIELKKDEKSKFLVIEENGKYITYNSKLVAALEKLLFNSDYSQSEINNALERFNIRTKQEIRLIREELMRRKCLNS
jgi:hypothetical protein